MKQVVGFLLGVGEAVQESVPQHPLVVVEAKAAVVNGTVEDVELHVVAFGKEAKLLEKVGFDVDIWVSHS